MAWSISDIEKLQAAGKIRGYTGSVKPKPVVKQEKARKVPAAVIFIEDALKTSGVQYEAEYRFADNRKFRFDFAIIDKQVAIEYEGIVSGKSRHTTITGYTRDADKYNLAASLGWKVYRYTALNYKNFESDLKAIMK